ncbi:glutamine amidotransferase [bacterium]|nr:glutamine amidotransferase [bacterium]
MSYLHFSLQPNRLWLVIATILISVAVLYWNFKCIERRKSLFFILRLSVYLLLIFLLLEPVRTVEEKSVEEPSAAFLIDTSTSMGVKDPISRFSLVKEFLKGPLVGGLKEKYNLLFFTFASTFKRAVIEEILQLIPQGKSTDIGQALDGLEEELRGQRLAGVFLVTDGAHNVGEDPRLVAERISVPIFSIGVGNPKKFKDLQIAEVRVSDFVFKNTPTDIGVEIRSYGFEGKEISVILKGESEILQTKKVRMPEDGKEVSLSLSFTPRSIGSFNYAVSIPSYSGEVSFANNRKDFTLQVLRDKIRILYICGQPSWEYKFLRTVLKSDPGIELVSFIILRNPENISIVPEDQLSLIPFPVTEIFGKEIFNFDLLIFENFTYTRFGIPKEYLENIRKFVTQTGGGFLMIGGDNSFAGGGYKGTPIEEILPVEMEDGKEDIIDGKFKMLLGESTHLILRLSDNPGENSQIWAGMPELDGCNRLLKPKPEAIILGVHPLIKNKYGNLVILAVWEKGKGRVMSMASNSTWQWCFQARGRGGTGSHYERFWHQAIHWLVKSPELKLVHLSTDKEIYAKREEILLTTRVFNRYYRPSEHARVYIELVNPSGKRIDLGTASAKDRSGEYGTNYLAEEEGNYTFIATAGEGSKVLGRDTASCKVAIPSLESENAQLNEPLLRELSDSTGGKYFHINSIVSEEIILPEVREATPVVKRVVAVWNNPYIFFFLFILLSIEWYIRRRSGMM